MTGTFSWSALSLCRALFITLILVSPQVFSHQKGDTIVRAGAGFIDPEEKSDLVKIGEIELGEIGVENITVPMINISYFASDKLAFELLLGKPPNFDVTGTSGLIGGVPIGNVARRCSMR